MSFDYIDDAAILLHETDYPYCILLGSPVAGQVIYAVDSKGDIDNRYALAEALRQMADELEEGRLPDMENGMPNIYQEEDDEGEEWKQET